MEAMLLIKNARERHANDPEVAETPKEGGLPHRMRVKVQARRG